MKILDLNHFNWANGRTDVKLLRHKDSLKDLWRLKNEGKFEEYQNHQSTDIIGSASYIISFIADRYKGAKFVGVWKVIGKSIHEDGGYQYATEESTDYEDLIDRLIVDWGDGTRSWAQWLHTTGNKNILEILPINSTKQWPGFYDVILDYIDLEKIIKNPTSHRQWKTFLSSVSGIYLILDKQSGQQYVGSASGENGIWGRWGAYITNPSGGNVKLEQLLKLDPERFKNFQFSILRVFEFGLHPDLVLAHESLCMRKLGSRAFGLN